MYNVKGPSKIVAKTARRGIPQNLDNFRDHLKNRQVENDYIDANSDPKPVFQNVTKKIHHNHHRHEENITPQHEEIIKYIKDSWNSVCAEMEQVSTSSDSSSDPKSEKSIGYYVDEPCPRLREFKPFELEQWWGRRLFTYITTSVNTKS